MLLHVYLLFYSQGWGMRTGQQLITGCAVAQALC